MAVTSPFLEQEKIDQKRGEKIVTTNKAGLIFKSENLPFVRLTIDKLIWSTYFLIRPREIGVTIIKNQFL